MKALGALLIAAAVITLPGCGRFAKSDSVAPTTTLATDGEVGAGIGRRETTTTAARPGTTRNAGNAATAKTTAKPDDTRCPPPPANSNRTNHSSGWQVAVIVSTKTCFAARESFPLNLSIVNGSKQTLYYDPNQSEYFEITGNGRRWADRSCQAKQEQVDAGPSELGPGREAIFTTHYPVPEKSERSGDPCLLPSGEYSVVGILEWCPASANTDGYCSPEESQPIRTPPVKIRIG